MNLPPCFTDPEAKRVLRQLCTEQQIDVELLQDLCALMHENTGKARIEDDDQIAMTIDRFLERGVK
jgi:hypothetical protein